MINFLKKKLNEWRLKRTVRKLNSQKINRELFLSINEDFLSDNQKKRLTEVRRIFDQKGHLGLKLYYSRANGNLCGGADFFIPVGRRGVLYVYELVGIIQPGNFEESMDLLLTRLERIAGTS
jgi:hypothetical protein